MKKIAFASAAALCFPGAAWAQSDGADRPVGSVYVKVGVGGVFARDIVEEQGADDAATAFRRRRSDVENGIVAAAAVGFAYPAGTRTELEYRYQSPTIDSVIETGDLFLPDVLVEPEDGATTHLLMSNVYYDFRNKSPVTPFIGAGVGGAFVSNGLGESDAAFAFQGKAGFEAEIAGDVALGVEYAYTRSRDLAFGDGASGFEGGRFEASTVTATVRKTF